MSPTRPELPHATVPRITPQEALELYQDCPIHELGRRALAVTQRLHPEPYRTYVVDRNINYSNICTADCAFCGFKVAPGRPGAFVLSFEQIARKIEQLVAIGGTQVLLQGGQVPKQILPFEWYLQMLRFIRQRFPEIHIHGFSPPEIIGFHRAFGMSIRDVLLRLREAGLDTIPGGGAEILVDRIRRRISPGKATTAEYLEVMRQAHRIGMWTSATMMFGHIETVAERIEHLQRIRDLQDEAMALRSGQAGGFTAFICWTFQPGTTRLGKLAKQAGHHSHPRDEASDGWSVRLAGANEYLRMLAIARLFLDNVPNLQASWVTQGPKIAQLALFYGANDMGSVMMEENVVSAAGTTYHLSEQQIRWLIREAGWIPKKRNAYYQLLE